jgi:8-oxo-dGTP pyrophosphatase MutT (NUDIX family)
MFEEDGEARIILTRRAANLRSHRSEVSFPGGRTDVDESPEAGALREAAEEVDLDPSAVTIEGRLSTVSTFTSSNAVVPVVGFLRGRPQLTPNPAEVEHVFDVSLADLLTDGVFREEIWLLPERPPQTDWIGTGVAVPAGSRRIWFFELPDDVVWGATARIIVELLTLVVDV